MAVRRIAELGELEGLALHTGRHLGPVLLVFILLPVGVIVLAVGLGRAGVLPYWLASVDSNRHGGHRRLSAVSRRPSPLRLALGRQLRVCHIRDELQARGLDVWMVDAQVGLGESLVTGIDHGIGSSRCGICFVTLAYVDPDRFWPRQELAALIMGRKRVIPVISGLGFDDVEEFSSLLGDRKGLSTDTHGLDEIADLIVGSVGGGTSGK
jgi:hypothetical protein